MKNSGLALILQASVAIASFIETFIFTRSLGLAMFGTFTIVYSISELIYGILDFRTGEAIIKYYPEVHKSKGNLGVGKFLRFMISIDFTIAVTGFLIIFLLNNFLLSWFKVEEKFWIILLLISSGAACKFAVRGVGAYFRIINQAETLIKYHVGWVVFKLLFYFVLFFTNPDITLIAIGSLVADFSFFLITAFIALRSYSQENLLPFKHSEIEITEYKSSILKFIFSTNIASTLKVISTKFDVLLISTLSPIGTAAAVAGLYKLAQRLSGALLLFSDPLLTAVYPEMARLNATGDYGQIKKLLLMLSKGLAVVCSLFFVIVYFLGEQILQVFGKEYANAQSVILTMIVGVSTAVIFFWARPLMLVRGMASKTIWATLISIIVQFALIYFLVPKIGVLGAGVAYASSFFTATAVFLFFLFVSKSNHSQS